MELSIFMILRIFSTVSHYHKNLALLLVCYFFLSCGLQEPVEDQSAGEETPLQALKVNLYEGESDAFMPLKRSFQNQNAGYGIDWMPATLQVIAKPDMRVLFVQRGSGTATLSSGDASKIWQGDLILLRPGVGIETDSLIDYLSFSTPDDAPASLPAFIRPDWDPDITDTPGGCATETGAYRRILLTWLEDVGPYIFHSINAHRVRIMDSFTHYHPKDGGFDEFYLVQMAMPGARLLVSDHTMLIEDYESMEEEQLEGLLKEIGLKEGDLVYLPRGLIHRGLDGVLAQVITIPGFKPGSEIGVDYYLRKINQRFQLNGPDSLPYHYAASSEVLIK